MENLRNPITMLRDCHEYLEQHPNAQLAKTALFVGLSSVLMAPNPESAVTVAATLLGFSTARKLIRHLVTPIVELGTTALVLSVSVAHFGQNSIDSASDQALNRVAGIYDSLPLIGEKMSHLPKAVASLPPTATIALIAGVSLSSPIIRMVRSLPPNHRDPNIHS